MKQYVTYCHALDTCTGMYEGYSKILRYTLNITVPESRENISVQTTDFYIQTLLMFFKFDAAFVLIILLLEQLTYDIVYSKWIAMKLDLYTHTYTHTHICRHTHTYTYIYLCMYVCLKIISRYCCCCYCRSRTYYGVQVSSIGVDMPAGSAQLSSLVFYDQPQKIKTIWKKITHTYINTSMSTPPRNWIYNVCVCVCI